MSEKGHLIITHIILILVLLSVDHGLHQLKVPSRGFLHSSIEIESVATSLLVVSWLHVFKFMSHCVWIIPHEIMEGNSESPWLLGEIVRIILNRGHPEPDRQELLRQLIGNDLLMTVVEQFERSSQEIRFQDANVILTERGEISNFRGDYEL